jgi:molybdenum cofactor cytidylyltransferase
VTAAAPKFDDLAGIVLAAGGSIRLGQPKQLVKYQGEALLCRAVKLAEDFCGAGVTVVTGAHKAAVEAVLQGRTVGQVHNSHWQQGMGGSIAVGAAAIAERPFAGLLIMLCDQPLVSHADIARLVEVWQDSPSWPAAARYKGSLGVPAIFPAAHASQLAGLSGDVGAKSLLQAANDVSVVDMPAAGFDIDSTADLKKLQNMQQAQS